MKPSTITKQQTLSDKREISRDVAQVETTADRQGSVLCFLPGHEFYLLINYLFVYHSITRSHQMILFLLLSYSPSYLSSGRD